MLWALTGLAFSAWVLTHHPAVPATSCIAPAAVIAYRNRRSTMGAGTTTPAAVRVRGEILLPSIVRAGGRRGWLAALVCGALLGAAGLALPALLSDRYALPFFAVFLGMVAGVYLGFALNDGRASVFSAEWVGLVLFGALAVLALSVDEPLLLAVGYIGHGLWDALHPHGLDTKMPWWYVPACVGFDLVFGVYIAIRFA